MSVYPALYRAGGFSKRVLLPNPSLQFHFRFCSFVQRFAQSGILFLCGVLKMDNGAGKMKKTVPSALDKGFACVL